MRKSFPILAILLLLAVGQQFFDSADQGFESVDGGPVSAPRGSDSDIAAAFRDRRSNFQVSGTGIVARLLADDNDGSRHQRFILELATGQTLMVAHNIDLAPRINGLRNGDRVDFFGEYEWNEQGGVIHWTHADPAGRHVAGWLDYGGRRYQ